MKSLRFDKRIQSVQRIPEKKLGRGDGRTDARVAILVAMSSDPSLPLLIGALYEYMVSRNYTAKFAHHKCTEVVASRSCGYLYFVHWHFHKETEILI